VWHDRRLEPKYLSTFTPDAGFEPIEMLSEKKTVQQISDLILLLPGVEIIESKIANRRATIRVAVANASSMLALQRATEGANAGFRPWVTLSAEQALPPTECVISVSTKRFEDLHCGYLQLLGVFLTWHLHRAQTIDTRRANRLLRKWHGALVDNVADVLVT
jgi:hypothetical protein